MIRIAIPNKGRLAEKTFELLDQAGLRAAFRSERALTASLGPGFEAILVRAQDIPELVADGAAELGVTGADLVAEAERPLLELLDLGFGKCRLVLAARDDSELQGPSDVPAGCRVATSFPNITRRYLAGHGVEAEVVPVSGAAEIAPHIGVADIIVDLTSTGSTLRVNGLREVSTILESTARLVARPEAMDDAGSSKEIQDLVAAVESVLRAARKRYLMANVPRARLEEVREVIPGLSGPTIVEVLDGETWVAAHAVVEADQVYQTISKLKDLGAEGILVTRIERLMP